jgi:zinc/manganese transport system substrate-binding protein
MAEYLHLDLVTPYDFMKAVAEGNDPPMNSEATFYKQIQQKAFKVLVYNVQTVTPLTTNIKESAARQNIGVIGVSETIQPPIDTFQEWMDGELSALANALNADALGH